MEERMEEQHTPKSTADPQGQETPNMEERLAAALQQIEALRTDNLRILADSENFKKRLTREKEEQCKFAVAGLVEELLVVLDNLELALTHCNANEACKDLYTGVDMTRNAMLEVLRRHGLTPIEVQEGADFDPAIHEALGHEARADLKPGTVARVLQNGYILKDRLLRPAKVMVASTPEGA